MPTHTSISNDGVTWVEETVDTTTGKVIDRRTGSVADERAKKKAKKVTNTARGGSVGIQSTGDVNNRVIRR